METKASFVDKFREGSYLQITQDDPLRNKSISDFVVDFGKCGI